MTAGWANVINLDHTSPPSGYDYFMEWYLAQMQAAGAAAGERLLDVLDMHLYSEATDGGSWDIRNEYAPQTANNIVVREQAPRTYWDPAYFELSWITDWGVVPPCGYSCTPREIPRVEQMITQYYPPFSRSDNDVGTKLGVSEWFFERAGDMSGGIAAADMLGIFGREGVYQASAWPNTSQWANGYSGSLDTAYACLWAAFSAYLNFDGAGGHFGDMSTPTSVTDPGRPVDWLVSGASRGDGSTYPTQYLERIAAYTSYDAADPSRVVIVAINKSINQDGSLPQAFNVGFQVKHTVQLSKANVYRIGLGTPFSATDSTAAGWPAAAAGCTGPTKLNGASGAPDLTLTATNAFNLSLPSQSVTVIVLTP